MYQSTSSSAVSVTSFGAKGDGAADDRGPIQTAIDNFQSKGLPGTIHFPRGTYLWSGQLNVTGNGLTFLSNDGAILKAFPDESAKKFNLSGAKNIAFRGLTMDAGRRIGSHNNNQNGFISTINVENLEVASCNLFNCRDSMVYLGGGTRFARIVNNHFTGHFCGIFGFVNSGEQFSEGFVVSNNTFGASWLPPSPDVGESACVKLQSFPGTVVAYTGVTRGHVIANNTIDSSTQMGIEVWSKGRGLSIIGNTVTNVWWGISLDNQEGATVVGNTVKTTKYIGIECASICRDITIANNTVDGFAGVSGYTRVTSLGIVSSNTTCDSITYNGNVVMGCNAGITVQNTTNTIFANNIVRDNNINIHFQGNSLSKLYGNIFEARNTVVAYHLFFDATNRTLSGFHLANNTFRGATSNQSIFYYNNGAPYTVQNLCVENNFTDGSTEGGYGVFIGGQFTPSNYVYRYNFGPTGSTTANSIQDASDDPAPFSNANILGGISYFGTQTYTIPANGITGNGIWLCIWSGGGGYDNELRVRAFNYSRNTSVGEIVGSHAIEVYASMNPYSGPFIRDTITANACNNYNDNVFTEFRTQKHSSSSAHNSLWVKIKPLSTGFSGDKLYFSYSKENNLQNVYATYAQPSWDSNTAQLNTAKNIFTLQTSRGYSVGTGSAIVSQNNRDLEIVSNGRISLSGAGITLITGSCGIGTLSPTAQLHTTQGVRFAGIGGAGTVNSDANGNLTVSSDERLKIFRGQFNRGLSDLSGITPVLFQWKPESRMDTGGVYAGFFAQNVAQFIPEATFLNGDQFYALSDRPIIAALVNSVNELAAKVRILESGKELC